MFSASELSEFGHFMDLVLQEANTQAEVHVCEIV